MSQPATQFKETKIQNQLTLTVTWLTKPAAGAGRQLEASRLAYWKPKFQGKEFFFLWKMTKNPASGQAFLGKPALD